VAPEEKKPEQPAAAPSMPGFFYAVTLTLSLLVAAVPFILTGIRQGGMPAVAMIDVLGALTAGVIFWAAALLGLVKSIRIFGAIAGGAAAATLGTPHMAVLLFLKSSQGSPSAWLAMASFAVIFSGGALLLWFVLGAVCGGIDKWLKTRRAALALDFILGAALGLALILSLSVVYSIAVPEMTYTGFWRGKAEELLK
jgi:hypothetical protein